MSAGQPTTDPRSALPPHPPGDQSPMHPAADPLAETPVFGRVFHHSPVGMAISDAEEDRFVAVNDAFARLMGYAPAEMHGRTPVELGLQPGEAHAATLALRRDPDAQPEDLRLWRGRDGAPRELRTTYQRIDLHGRPHHICIIQDLSERSRLQNALARTETHFRLFFESTPLALIVRDTRSGAVIDVNDQACRLFGIRRAALATLPPGALPAAVAGAGAAPIRHTTTDGRTIDLAVTSYAFELDGRPARMDAIHDVTDHLAVQNALRESEQRLRLVADKSNDGLWDWDLVNNRVWRNRGPLFVDLPPGAPIEAWTERMDPDDLARMWGEFDAALAERAERWTSEYRVRRPNGSWANVLQRMVILYDDDRPVRVVGVVVDITAPLVLAEAEAQAALAEREQVARGLHDAVTQSLYSASLLAEAARRQAQDARQEGATEFIGRFGQLTQAALRQMRLLLYELRPAVFDQEGLLGALGHRLDSVERAAGIGATLVTRGEAMVPPDLQSELYWVAHEALNNALRHAAATAVTVQLDTRDDRIVLEVSDNGRGFRPERAHGGGGLAGMRARSARLGASLAIISRPDHGTRVRVTLPAGS